MWWNPHGLFGLEDGQRVDAKTFYRLHQGYAPFDPHDPNDLGEDVKLTRNAGSPDRVAAYDLTFSADKSVSTLWAMTHGEDDRLHRELARAHDDAVRSALDLIIDKHCAWTRRRREDGPLEAIRARIMAAAFQHQSSRENEPQLHTHCVIFNAALSDDGKWRSLHARPLYEWRRTAGSIYRLALAWNITQRLGLAVERHGREGEFFRIRGVPQDLQDHWSSRSKQIVGAAKALGFATADNRAAAQRINKATRRAKDKSLDPVGRQLFWAFDRARFVEDVQAVLEEMPPHLVTEEDKAEVSKLLDEIPKTPSGTSPPATTSAWSGPVRPAASRPPTGSASTAHPTAKRPSSTSSSAPSARTPSTATTPTPTNRLAQTIEAIKESYRAVTKRAGITEKAEAVRSPTYLETLRTHRSLLERARQALRRIVKRHQHRKTAERAGITRESLVDWIHDYAARRREFNAAAAMPHPSRAEYLRALETEWRAVIDAARQRNVLPIHAPGWRAAVDRLSAALQKRTVPEESQRRLNPILESQRTAFRYDREARNFIRLIGATHDDAKALFAASQGPHDPTLDWAGIRERRDALRKVIDHLPPADEIDPYLAHYDARANSGLGDAMLARLNRNLHAATRQQIEIPAAELVQLATETTELRHRLRQTMSDGGLPALYDNADLDRLRDITANLGRAVSAGSDLLDPKLRQHGATFAAITGLANDTSAAIDMIDRRLDESAAGAARDLMRLRTEAERYRDTPFPDDNLHAARLISDFERTLSAIDRQLNTLPPAARVDSALGKLEADLTVSSLRTELAGFHAHLRLANRSFFGHSGTPGHELLADTFGQARRDGAPSADLDRSQATEKAVETDRDLVADRHQTEKKTEEEDRRLSQDEDTGISIM